MSVERPSAHGHGNGHSGGRAARTPVVLEGPEHKNGSPCLLTAEDLAGRWQVEVSQVYRLTRSGVLPVVRLGRYCRYRLDAIEEFERAGGGAADV